MASPTKAEIEQENAELKNRIAQLESQGGGMSDEDRQEIAATKEALRIQEELNVEADDRIAELEAQVGKLSEKATDRPATGDLPRVEVDGTNYQITAPRVNIKGRKLTADELAEDQDLLVHLVEIDSQILKAL